MPVVSYMLSKHRSNERSSHSPQGVETGDLRSSRHMPQVSSDMPSTNVVPPHWKSATKRYGLYANAYKPLGSASVVDCGVGIRARRDAVTVTCAILISPSPSSATSAYPSGTQSRVRLETPNNPLSFTFHRGRPGHDDRRHRDGERCLGADGRRRVHMPPLGYLVPWCPLLQRG